MLTLTILIAKLYPINDRSYMQYTNRGGSDLISIFPTGLSGSNLLENTEVFGIVDAAEDAWCSIYTARYKQKDKETTVTNCGIHTM